MKVQNAERGAMGALRRATLIAYAISREKRGSLAWYKLCDDYMKALSRYLLHLETLKFLGLDGKAEKLSDFPGADIPAALIDYYRSNSLIDDFFDPI